MIRTKLIGLDCGENITGVAIITEKGIDSGYNIPNDFVYGFIQNQKENVKELIVVIEDVRPYNMRITDGIIKTIKFIGELEWRLKAATISFTLIPRWEVKKWIFDRFRDMAEPEIVKKIEYSKARKEKLNEYINPRKQSPTFIYVDDRIVQKAMRILWKITKPKVGSKAAYNLKDHSWQALALISLYIVLHKPASLLKLTSV